MPHFEHVVELQYRETFRTAKVAGMFDVPVEEKLKKSWKVDIPCEQKEWNIGLIVGPSGCGKTTLGRIAFGEENYHEGYTWPDNEAFLEGFRKSLDIKEITEALSHVGFS